MAQVALVNLKVPDCPQVPVRPEVRVDPAIRQVPRVPAVRVDLPVLQPPITRARLGLLGHPVARESLAAEEGQRYSEAGPSPREISFGISGRPFFGGGVSCDWKGVLYRGSVFYTVEGTSSEYHLRHFIDAVYV